MASAKPVIHGRDHHHGGADPIALFIEYDYANLGKWLQVETTDATVGAAATTAVGSYTNLGVAVVDSSTSGGGIVIGTSGGGNIAIDTDAQIALTALDGNVYIQDAVGGIGSGTGLLTVGFGNGMNFNGGFTEFAVAGFEVDSTLGLYLSDTSAAAAGVAQITSAHNFIQVLAGADHGHTHIAGDVALEADGRINLDDHGGGININSLGGAGIVLNASSVTGVSYPGGGTRPIVINSSGSEGGTTGPTIVVGIADGDLFEIFRNDTFASLMSVSTAGVQMHTLPTSNPGGSGLLWKNGNVVNIT